MAKAKVKVKVKAEANQPEWKRFRVEVVRHAIAEEKPYRVESPQSGVGMFREDAARLMGESLWVMTLDGRNGLMGIEQVYSGTATGTSVRMAELFRYAVQAGGVGVVLVHNHPSGDSQESEQDIQLTKDAIAAGKLLDIEVLDHLVIATGGHTSIRGGHQSLWAAA
jgi:DNA repair protein RadC